MSTRCLIWLLLLIYPMVTMAAAEHKHVKHKHWTKKYDRHFKKNSKHYFGPGINWRLFKAQGIAESGLNPKAKSDAGALGIMQIMPDTYMDILKRKPNLGRIQQPRWNIAAAIYYDRQLYKTWLKKEIPADERMKFTFGSYNSGVGNILKARKKLRKQFEKDNIYTGEAVKEWQKIEPFVPSQTRHYVRRIYGLMQVP